MARHAVILAGGLVAAVAALATTATPASAHATGGLPATNWRSAVTAVRPDNGVLQARVTDLGNHIELRAAPGHEVIIEGYAGEPYLRFDATGGVDENTRSPATYLNRTSTLPGTPTPKSYDPNAAPQWTRVASGHLWRWHDHRAHHMAGDTGGHEWIVPVLVDGHQGVIAGRITYVDAPAPLLPIAAGAVALALALLVDRAQRVTLMFTGLACVAIVLLVGIARFGTGGPFHDAAGILYALIAIVGALGAAVFAARRPASWSPSALLGGLAVLVAGGLTFVGWITHSQLPATLPGALARVIVAVFIGAGAGCVASGVRRLRPVVPAASPTP